MFSQDTQEIHSKLTSIAVSSLTEDAIAPALVAPMALDKARAVANPLPVPSCSTDTKQGNPLPFSYNERTEEPIILQPLNISCINIEAQIPGCNHNDILRRFEFEELVKDVVATGNNDGGICFQRRRYLAVVNARLDLIRDKKEQHYTNGS